MTPIGSQQMLSYRGGYENYMNGMSNTKLGNFVFDWQDEWQDFLNLQC
jgi:hypothetical protein